MTGIDAASVALAALVVVPALTGGFLALTGTAADRVAAPVSTVAAGTALALGLFVALQRPSVSFGFMAGAAFGLGVDGLAAMVTPTVAAVTLLVLVFAAADVREAPARFHGLMLLFAAAASLTVVATTLPALLMAWEVMGATSYALIGFHWRRERHVSSGLVAFLTTRTADVGLYVAAGAALAGGVAGMEIGDLDLASSGWRNVLAAGVLVAALGKAAQLPFSFWLRRAMDGPSPVSALLHSAAMVALGGYLLLRTSSLLLATGWAGHTVAWAGAATTVMLGLVACAQSDLKQLLAASTSAQLGFVVLAAGVGATAGGVDQLVAHAAVKSLLFLCAGAWLSALGTRQLAALSGAARRWPVVGVTATVGLVSLAGIPPLALWATKDAVLAGALESSGSLYLVGLLGSALSAVYSAKVLVTLWRPLPAEPVSGYDEVEVGSRYVPWLAQAPLLPLAAGALTLGLLALPPLAERVRGLLAGSSTKPASAAELSLSAVLALGSAVATGLVLTGRLSRVQRVLRLRPALSLGARPGNRRGNWWGNRLAGWLGLEGAAHRLVVVPSMSVARTTARLDDQLIDRAVHAVAARAARAAGWSAGADLRGVDGAVRGVAATTRRLGAMARLPQTGQLHQYYLQVLVVLGVMIAVLVSLG